MDRNRDCLAPLSGGHESPEQRASTSLQELDLSMGTMVFGHPQFISCAGARMEQL